MTDPHPFRRLYEANHQPILRLLARIVGARDAEDLTQVVFARAARALPRFRGESQAATWLYRIAVNSAADWLRSRATHEERVTVPLPEQADPATPDSSPEQDLVRKEMGDCIQDVMSRLPPRDRAVLMLGELGGLTDAEVAETLGITRGNAKVRLHRARARLKVALEAGCDFYRNDDNEFACEPKRATGCAPGANCSTARR